MKIYFAPMEGITYPEFRIVHNKYFPEADAYFAPFLAPGNSNCFKEAYLKKKLPDIEHGIKLIPQLLANSSAPFTETQKTLMGIGYDEVNLNVGCPSGTVFAKYKGSGMLRDLDTFKLFLDGVFANNPSKISVKTRMGVSSTSEFDEILSIYNDYQMTELIVHARDRNGMYDSTPDLDKFIEIYNKSQNTLVYNGDIFSPASLHNITNEIPDISGVMVGRGALANPALIRILKGGEELKLSEFKEYHDELFDAYLDAGLAPRFAAERMKSLWAYMNVLFKENNKALKYLRKSKDKQGYFDAVKMMYDLQFDGGAYFVKFEK